MPLVCVLIGGGPQDGLTFVAEDGGIAGYICDFPPLPAKGEVCHSYRQINRPGVFVYDGWRKA